MPFSTSGDKLTSPDCKPVGPVAASLSAAAIKLEYRFAVCLGNTGRAWLMIGDNRCHPFRNNCGTGSPPLPGAIAAVNSYRESRNAPPKGSFRFSGISWPNCFTTNVKNESHCRQSADFPDTPGICGS